MIRTRARAAGITTKIGNHTFLGDGDHRLSQEQQQLEKAAAMLNHASTRTT